jgi:hypothetical protein
MLSSTASPKPVPLGRVVKNGSNARLRTASSIPGPSSITLNRISHPSRSALTSI